MYQYQTYSLLKIFLILNDISPMTHYIGRLAGRQGWVFEDTFLGDNEPLRLVLGVTDCIPGLEIGIAGDGENMPPMK